MASDCSEESAAGAVELVHEPVESIPGQGDPEELGDFSMNLDDL
jgi:hypothetical protein